jgi:hypothetical protein
MVDPGLERFGLALKHGVAILHFSGRGGSQGRISLHPPDGALGVPRAFGEKGELPDPVPGGPPYGKGCGFPVLVRLVPPYHELLRAEVTDAAGRAVRGTISSPAKPANPDWPTNSGCAVFIPSKPLAPNSMYRVRFDFREPKEPLEWAFATGSD